MTSIGARIQQVQYLCKIGKYLDAREMLVPICEEMPGDVNAWYLLSSVNGFLGEYENAAECARKVITLEPQIPEGYSNLGVALLKLEKPVEAQDAFLKALSLRPDRSQDYNNLGVSLCAQANYEQAVVSFEKAVALDSGFADAYYNLGGACVEVGLHDRALESFQCAAQLEPGIIKYIISLGFALIRDGQHDRAMWCASQALALDPDNLDAMCIKGAVYAEKNHYLKAIVEYERAVALMPERADLHNALGKAHLIYGASNAALNSFQEAVRLDGGSIDILYNLARGLEDTGELEQALTKYQEVVSRSPDHVDAICGQARIYEKVGDFTRSLELIVGLIKGGQVSTRVLEAYTSLCRRFGHCDEAARQIEEYLMKSRVPRGEESRLRFLLGKLYDRDEKYDAAFKQYETANMLKGVTYDVDSDNIHAEKILRIFNEDQYRKIPSVYGRNDITPIFIVGMPRSGSTLVEQILASHTDVYGGDELPFIGDVLGKIEVNGITQRWPEYVPSLDRETCEKLAEKYLGKLRKLAPGYHYVTDKMPHNFPYIGLIHKLFPDAPLIYTKRNPLDTCLSCFFQNFSTFHAYAFDLKAVGMHYRLHQKIMDHYLEVLELPLFVTQYENNAENLEGNVRALLRHCGLEWDDACMRFYEYSRRSRTASYDQVRQPIYTHSIERWRHYEKHIDVLLDVLEKPVQS